MTLPRMALLLVVWLAFFAPLSGCSCWKDPLADIQDRRQPATLEEMEARRKELQEKQDQKPDFETIRLTVLPADDAPTKNQVKPGHWFNAVQTMKANNFDFPKGELDAQCVDTMGNAIPLPGSHFELRTVRPVSLPEGQSKHFDLLLFANMPPRRGTINFMTRLRPLGGGRDVDWEHEACTRMKPFQNHLVVLADRVDNYQFIKTLRSVKPERSSDEFLAAELDYFVKLPKGTRRVDLPSHPLAWSNIAYVIWDDYDPEILNGSQQQAMMDWLHWGGQLIINGPRTLDRLRGSFLERYLPAHAGDVATLREDQVAELNDYWTFQEQQDVRPLRLIAEQDPPLTVALELTDQAEYVPHTSNLIAAMTVGRGRVVVTAFNLAQAVFLAWDSYDGFFNSCLLDRPARRFYPQADGIVEQWAVEGVTRDDPRINSKVRYFSRDAMAVSTRSQRSAEKVANEVARLRQQTIQNRRPLMATDLGPSYSVETAPRKQEAGPVSDEVFGLAGFAKDDLIGVAGWSDQSDVSQAARDALQQSAGISVPSVDFIAKVLGVYLLVLVPLNWLIFRLLGHVEWAWVAVPIISMGGALGVVHAAQLDIGFARSRTEIAVMEIQPSYDRGHLTRYLGLYTSLSSSYRVQGSEESALFQPLAGAQRADREVALYQGEEVSLSGFNVLSNSTGMIHAEQMVPLGGTITWTMSGTEYTVHNQTPHGLQGACVVRCRDDHVVEVAWIGLLAANSAHPLQFSLLETPNVEFAEWETAPETRRASSEGDFNVRRLFDIATDPKRLGPEEAVLVGWNDQLVEGVTVVPSSSQISARTVYIAQLRHARRPPPRRDDNSFATFKREFTQDQKEGLDDGGVP